MRLRLLCAALLALSCNPDAPSAPPAPPSHAAQAPAAADGSFALRLYGQLAQTPGNLVYSPASVQVAFTMAWAGARGETATEMAQVLGISGPPDAAIQAAGDQLRAWNTPGEATLAVANRLFAARTLHLDPAFVSLCAESLAAPLEQLDFAGDPAGSRLHINQWVSDQTHQRIEELLAPRHITAGTDLVLVNAIYLKAAWAQPFRPQATQPAPFASPSGPREVPMMRQTGSFRLGRMGNAATLIELPYAGGALSMVIVLPDAADGLPAAEQGLDAAVLEAALAEATPQRVDLRLPRFRIEPATPVSLRTHLEALGMRRAWQGGQADFSGMTGPGTGGAPISEAVHKAFIEVNEQGTEAAAATALVMRKSRSAPGTPFHADHPFLFFIRDTRTGALLFLGRLTDPT
jgi:serpin B